MKTGTLSKKDWKEVWSRFDRWYESFRGKECTKCHHWHSDEPEWGDQAARIQKEVEKQFSKFVWPAQKKHSTTPNHLNPTTEKKGTDTLPSCVRGT